MRSTRRRMSSRSEIVDALLRLAFFAGHTRADVARLLTDADIVHLPRGKMIGRNGTPARQFVGVLDGYIHGTDASGRAFVVGPGDHIGTFELMADEDHDATYLATTTVTLVAVFGPTFRSHIRSVPELTRRASQARNDRRFGVLPDELALATAVKQAENTQAVTEPHLAGQQELRLNGRRARPGESPVVPHR